MLISQRKFFGSIIFLFQLFWLLIDTVNGVTLRYFSFSIGEFFRFFIVIALIIYYSIHQGNKKQVFLIPILLLILSGLHLLLFENFNSMKMLFKLFLIPLFLVVIPFQFKDGVLTYKRVKLIILFNLFFFSFNIGLSYLGYGYDNYVNDQAETSFGGVGFFFAGNEVGATLVALTSLTLVLFYNNKLVFYILCSFFLVLGAGVSSKTTIFGILLLLLFVIIKRNFWNIVWLSMAFIFILLYLSKDITSNFSNFITRLTYFGDLYGYDTLLLGGYKRIEAIKSFLSFLYDNPFSIFVGIGWNGDMENNFFDVLEAFGLLGLFFYFIIIFRLNILNRINKYSGGKVLFPVVVGTFLLILISILAGHVLQSAMISLFVGLALNMNLVLKYSNNENSYY